MSAGKVLKTMKPGDAGTSAYVNRFGSRLIAVRYRGNAKRRVRSTTVEVVVSEGFWMPHARSLAEELAKVCADMDTLVKQ